MDPKTQPRVQVNGAQNQVVTVGNDIVFAENYFQQKADFFTPKLDQYKSPPFVSPENIADLAVTLYTQRIFILGGSPEVDKDGLARHAAWYLASRIEKEKRDGLDHVEIKEWYHNSGLQNLLIGIQETKVPTIFILPQVTPTDIGYDPLRLQLEARKYNHFVILSSESPINAWKISSNGVAPSYWVELSPDALYSPVKLTDSLIQQLIASTALPEELSKLEFTPTTPLAGKILIHQAASQLKTPKNIAIFVEQLCQNKRPLTEPLLEEMLKISRDSGRVFAQWFLTTLKPHEQTAALGLGLFEGLFDDQFFTALEAVTEEAWRHRDPQLVYADYRDLENLGSFYSFVETQDGGFKIESKNPGQRKLLFDLLWSSYRRKLLVSLPILSRLVINSVDGREANPSLYGTKLLRRTLRESIGDSLSDLGLVSPPAVEESLIRLAADRDFAVQAVAAKAMARWREYGRDKDLFEILSRWQTETRFINIIKSIIEKRDEKSSEGPEAYIRATVAVTVGHAALYDPPNQLSDELVKLFMELADDRNNLVRDRFRGYTLPIIISQHLEQIRGELREIVRYVDMIQAIGASLARVYRINPEAVIDLLNAWYLECEKNRPKQINNDIITHRDALLATIVMTYGQINYDEGSRLLNADDAFKRLLKLMETERHRFVRTAIVLAITFQALDHFEMVEEQLRWLLPEVTPNEREEIVKILKQVYLKQRKQLEGGDDTMKLGEETYAVWSNTSKRPLTKVEQALYRWLLIEGNVAARQIATQAFIEFAITFDQPEQEFIRKRKEEAERKKQIPQPGTPLSQIPITRAIRQISFVQSAAAFLSTINAADIRPLIRDILPEASLQFRSRRAATEFVIEKWKAGQASTVSRAAKHLRKAIGLVENAPILIILAAAATLIGFCCSCWFLSSILDSLNR